MRHVIIDHQSTGISIKNGDRLVELVGIELIGEKMQQGCTFHAFIDPQRNIPPEVTHLHGINSDKLNEEGAKPFHEIAQGFLDFIDGATLVVYHTALDLAFINHELSLAGLGAIDHLPIIDVRETAKATWPEKSQMLPELCNRLGINIHPHQHGYSSMEDALVEVFRAISMRE